MKRSPLIFNKMEGIQPYRFFKFQDHRNTRFSHHFHPKEASKLKEERMDETYLQTFKKEEEKRMIQSSLGFLWIKARKDKI